MQVAQTNIQLYNQLRERGLPLQDLVTVHRAYELLTTLYSGHVQVDGKAFLAHGVGVASILAELDQPSEILAVGLLHNVYGNGDFGDGRGPGATAARRRLVREAVGGRIEQLVARFGELRVQWQPIAQTRRTLPLRDETERRLILVDLVDYLEKYVDLGILYCGPDRRLVADAQRSQSNVLEVARALDEPRLTAMLTAAHSAAAAAQSDIPGELQPSANWQYATLVVPRSCRRRLLVRLRAMMRSLRWRVHLRTRLRQSIARRGRRSQVSPQR